MASVTQFDSGPSGSEMEARLVVVDDDASIRELLVAALRFAGFAVHDAANGRAAAELIRAQRPDLIVLDVMLPDINGFEFTAKMRAAGIKTPVVFLTARGDPADAVRGLTAGGDDYLTKPFSLEELVARIRAVLRRSDPQAGLRGQPGSHVVKYADLELNEDTYEVSRAGVPVELSLTEFKLLRYLMRNAGRVLSKAQILDHVWDYDFAGDANIVESYISYLRKKIDRIEVPGTDGETGWPEPLIHTRRGIGYTLRAAK